MSSVFNIPAGWKLVPDSATHNMLNAANARRKKAGGSSSGAIYSAMLDAVPTPPVDAVPGEPLCACKDRPASQRDEEWGPNCDLGNNAKHVSVSTTDPALIDAAIAAVPGEPVACQMCSGHGLLGSVARFEDGGVECPECRGAGTTTPAVSRAVGVEPVQWQTPPASWRLLAKAVIDLLWAIDTKHDTEKPPTKYSVPYGAVNNLRRALGCAEDPPVAPAAAAEPSRAGDSFR